MKTEEFVKLLEELKALRATVATGVNILSRMQLLALHRWHVDNDCGDEAICASLIKEYESFNPTSGGKADA